MRSLMGQAPRMIEVQMREYHQVDLFRRYTHFLQGIMDRPFLHAEDGSLLGRPFRTVSGLDEHPAAIHLEEQAVGLKGYAVVLVWGHES